MGGRCAAEDTMDSVSSLRSTHQRRTRDQGELQVTRHVSSQEVGANEIVDHRLPGAGYATPFEDPGAQAEQEGRSSLCL